MNGEEKTETVDGITYSEEDDERDSFKNNLLKKPKGGFVKMNGKIEDDLRCLSINDSTGIFIAQQLQDAVDALIACEVSHFTFNENEKVQELLKHLKSYRSLVFQIQSMKRKYEKIENGSVSNKNS